MLPSRPRSRCRNQNRSLTTAPSAATGAGGQAPVAGRTLYAGGGQQAQGDDGEGRRGQGDQAARAAEGAPFPAEEFGGRHATGSTDRRVTRPRTGRCHAGVRSRRACWGRCSGCAAGPWGRGSPSCTPSVFLLSGVGLLALTFLLSGGSVSNVAPANSPPARSGPDAAQAADPRPAGRVGRRAQQQSRQLLAGSLVALVVMAVVSLLLGRVLAGRVLRPLRHDHRAPPGGSPRTTWTSGWRSAARPTRSRTSPTPSTGCSNGSRRRSPRSAGSSPTPRTSCAPRWRPCGRRWTWRSPSPTRPRRPSALADRLRTQLDRVDHLLDGLPRAGAGASTARSPTPAAVDLSDLVRGRRCAHGRETRKALRVTVDVPDGDGGAGAVRRCWPGWWTTSSTTP